MSIPDTQPALDAAKPSPEKPTLPVPGEVLVDGPIMTKALTQHQIQELLQRDQGSDLIPKKPAPVRINERWYADGDAGGECL